MKPVVSLALVLLTVALSLLAMEPPTPRSINAAPTVFSAERALANVRELARAPHPPGTTEHARVQQALVNRFRALGLTVRVQKTVAWRDEGLYVQAATVENIVARLPGKTREKSVMLAAHYDSHHTGPGAGDDGAGVAAQLEVARALRTGGPLERDVLFVVTDAEEWVLIGAQGFLNEAPEAREIGVVLNAEARGGGGPVFMFETSDHNAALIGHFAASVAQPRASSLMYALYKLLPNDTDLTLFKKAGLPGLNFAFAGQWTRYHTALDTPDRLDRRSLQQEGDALLALTKALVRADPVALTTGHDAVYFDILGRTLVAYPVWAAWLFTVLALVALGLALGRGYKESGFKRTLGVGIGLVPALLLVGGVVGFLFGLVIAPLRASVPWNDPYDARLLEAALFALVLGVVWLGVALQPVRLAARPLALGALCWWAVLLVASTVFLPGASYLFVWPLLAASIAQLGKAPLLSALAAVVTLILATPILHGLALLLGFGLPPVLGVLAALLALPLVPLFRQGAGRSRLIGPLVLLLAGTLCVVVGFLRNSASTERPRIDTLFYAVDADTQTARWVSADTKNDAWTQGFLGESKQTVPGTDFFPWSQRSYRVASAPTHTLAPPTITKSGNKITLRTAPGTHELVVSSAGVRSARLGGQPLPQSQNGFCLRFLAPPSEGVTLTLDASPQTELTVDTYRFELPEGTPPRPSGLIAQPIYPATDITLVRTHLRL